MRWVGEAGRDMWSVARWIRRKVAGTSRGWKRRVRDDMMVGGEQGEPGREDEI